MGSRQRKNKQLKRLIAVSLALTGLVFFLENQHAQKRLESELFPPAARLDPRLGVYLTQLAMPGGDPYIRALMRTISASEANDPRPYSILYGGDRINDLSQHPEQCITIVSGPNIGNCSTAAGRYQMLNTTWKAKAQRYHPHPPGLVFWHTYSFEPKFQDAVVYAWLSDAQAWNADIAELLKQGNLDQVLNLLSGTWTSLGYGIEDNTITSRLPKIYQQVLQEELKLAGSLVV